MINLMKGCLFLVVSIISLHTKAEVIENKVLASIHPLALVAVSVVPLENLQTLVPDGVTPHDFSLRPSDIDRLQEADIILWAGDDVEPYLSGFARRWPDKQWIDLSSFAEPGMPEDTHYWLSTSIVLKAQAELANLYGQDASVFASEVQDIITYTDELLVNLKTQGFYVLHSAYEHWVADRGLNQVGALMTTSEHKPGFKTVAEMRKQIKEGRVHCFFYEPEVSSDYVANLIGDLDVEIAELDPMGNNIGLSKDGYSFFLRSLADTFAGCLSSSVSDVGEAEIEKGMNLPE